MAPLLSKNGKRKKNYFDQNSHFLSLQFSETSEILEDALNQFINATTTEASASPNNCTTFEGRNVEASDVTTSSLVILPKEIIVVLIMLTLWIYSLNLTVRAWKQYLKD